MRLITYVASKAYQDGQSFKLTVCNPILVTKHDEVEAFLCDVQKGTKPKSTRLCAKDIDAFINRFVIEKDQKCSFLVYRASLDVANNQLRNEVWTNIAFMYRDPNSPTDWFIYAYAKARLDRSFVKDGFGCKLFNTSLSELPLEERT
ncbi:hypothetical protein QJ367_004289 [Vibrio vulnificus]|uniref:hypothetical protein n=1 Tax=Vibrio TaxID=662 RepID=UPI000577D865|nr:MULTISPECIES: hypothetical protein [Vibrio]EGQ7835295.1 hypothetical protein [Vibrio vulnificus]EGQ8028729.1 hypothetical protein [Vibrio vulnificus]EHH0849980.1 hypothetical protein [Vibrio vulnificus]EHU5129650.1 hypothetical protein [Vibrio vulnificus]EHV5553138.1 hypothetical protein [Vibrio vulnificus]